MISRCLFFAIAYLITCSRKCNHNDGPIHPDFWCYLSLCDFWFLVIAPSINYNSSLTNLVSSATWHFDVLHREQLARSLGSEWRSPMCLKCSSGRGLDLHCILKVIILALDIMPLGPNTNLFNPFTWSKDTSVSKSLSVEVLMVLLHMEPPWECI